MKTERSSFHGIDDLRFIATIGVILLHTSAGMLPIYGKIPDEYWLIGLFYNAITRFCVPMFVMISGALLLSRTYKTTDFLRRRFVRILLPFLFYATIYLAYHLIIRQLYGHHNSTIETFDWLKNKIIGGVSYHFWFVYLILSLYLIIPTLGSWVRNRSEKTILIILFIWFAYNIIQLFSLKISFLFSQTLNYIGYLLLGYYLSAKHFRNNNQTKKIGVILFIISYLVTFSMMAIHLPKLNAIYGNFSPTIIFMAIGAYIFFKNTFIKNSYWLSIRALVCRHSFGIYLIHILILKWLSITHIHWNFTHPAIAIPITVLLTLTLSTLFVFLISRMPYGKYISG